MALDGDVNEATSPVVPQMMMKDAFDYNDKAIYRALAGGVTSSLLLHGSADMIGGQAVVIKNKYGLDRDQMLFPGRAAIHQVRQRRKSQARFRRQEAGSLHPHGQLRGQREAFTQAKDYSASGTNTTRRSRRATKTASPPKKDLKLEALVQVLRGKMLVQIHCYRADEFLTEIAIANEFGYKIRAFHHALESYKVPEALAEKRHRHRDVRRLVGLQVRGLGRDSVECSPAMRAGVRVAIKSDSDDYMRRLNQEAAKTMRYGGATEDEAMKMLTLNPAWIMGVEDKTGSIDVGKDADLVLWDGYPLSTYGVPAQGMDRRGLVLRPSAARPRHAPVPGGTVMLRIALRLSLIALLFVSAAVAQQKAPAAKLAVAPTLDPHKAIAITGGKLLTITHGTIDNGELVIENGKISSVGTAGVGKPLPAGAQVIDAKGMTVYPGLIDSETHLGLTEISAERNTNDLVEPSDEIMPHMHVADAFHAESALIPVARFNGITNAIVAPDSKDTLPGQDSFIQLAGADASQMLLIRDIAMPLNFTGSQRRNESFANAQYPADSHGHGRADAAGIHRCPGLCREMGRIQQEEGSPPKRATRRHLRRRAT